MTRAKQAGVVSLIVVIFTSILLMIVTTGFIRTMMQEETRASNNNLSRMAYESAVAGVEDGKRVISACQRDGAGSVACNAIERKQCSTVQDAGVLSGLSNTETTIKSGSEKKHISGQAYTCVLIESKTIDVKYNITQGNSRMTPLRVNQSGISIMRVQWMVKNDRVSTISTPPTGTDSLPQQSSWKVDTPALLRLQIIVPDNGLSVDSLQSLDGASVSTVFLRPSSISATQAEVESGGTSFNAVQAQGSRAANNTSNDTTAKVSPVRCSEEAFNIGLYACSAYVSLPRSLVTGSNMSFVNVMSIYNDSDVRLSFDGVGDGLVRFDGVQPQVDATGRASDVYRRISSRVSLANDIVYPQYAVDITGSLCKDFSVTNQGVESSAMCSVQPVEQ